MTIIIHKSVIIIYSDYMMDVSQSQSSILISSTGELTGSTVSNVIAMGGVPISVMAGNTKAAIVYVSVPFP